MSEPTEMELRVAKALYEYKDPDADAVISMDEIPWDLVNKWVRRSFLRKARAAIRAMREPTDGMIKDGWLSADRDGWDGPGSCWELMIDAASPGA